MTKTEIVEYLEANKDPRGIAQWNARADTSGDYVKKSWVSDAVLICQLFKALMTNVSHWVCIE
jgi:hypothetical protein